MTHNVLSGFAAAILLVQTATAQPSALPRLRVSENGRFLVTESGKPFFYLGDTAWELFNRLNREEAVRYLEDRAHKGYNVIQAVALGAIDSLRAPNPYGHLPLINNDPARPDVREGAANDYWDHVDFIVRKANSLGLYIGLLPGWGYMWNKKGSAGLEIFTPANAEAYGQWLGRRYQSAGIIWILGGDHPVESALHFDIIRSMARGLRSGDGGDHLITFHPSWNTASADYFQADSWLSFNMLQNGHGCDFTGRYDRTARDYGRSPAKPIIDGEPVYEDTHIAVDFKAVKPLGYSISYDVRRALYWNVFSGACGHTYGHESVWQMWSPGRHPIGGPVMSWADALAQPGAAQMIHGRRLIESRPYLTRIPDDSVIASDSIAAAVPGEGRYRFVATRDSSGSYAMVYAAVGRAFRVRMDKISGSRVVAWWYNPRNGKATRIGVFRNTGERPFIPPDPGEMLDWILVLDDESKRFGPPGAVPYNR